MLVLEERYEVGCKGEIFILRGSSRMNMDIIFGRSISEINEYGSIYFLIGIKVIEVGYYWGIIIRYF